MSNKNTKKDDELKSWYQLVPKSMKTQYHNPCKSNHGLEIPFRMIIVGNSGSGKTTLVLEILHRMADTFGHITIVTANKDEPLYKFLTSKLKPEELDIREGYENIPKLEDLDRDVQHLVVFDDLVLERRQDSIAQYFIRSRKIAKGVSCMYLTQSYFAVPKVIRLQCSYILLKKLTSTRDLNFVLKDFSLGTSREKLLEIYKYCLEDPKNFMMVDIHAQPEDRFRCNFSEIIPLEEEEK
jgi:predicted ATP-binding protein involved in virulence